MMKSKWASKAGTGKRTATPISTKPSEPGHRWRTRRRIAKHCCNFGTASRLSLPGLLLETVITRGETIRAFRTEGNRVRRLFPPDICRLAWLQERRQSEDQPEQAQRGRQSDDRRFDLDRHDASCSQPLSSNSPPQ